MQRPPIQIRFTHLRARNHFPYAISRLETVPRLLYCGILTVGSLHLSKPLPRLSRPKSRWWQDYIPDIMDTKSHTRCDSAVNFPVDYSVSIGILAIRFLQPMLQSAYFRFRNYSPEITQCFRALFGKQVIMIWRTSPSHHQLERLNSR